MERLPGAARVGLASPQAGMGRAFGPEKNGDARWGHRAYNKSARSVAGCCQVGGALLFRAHNNESKPGPDGKINYVCLRLPKLRGSVLLGEIQTRMKIRVINQILMALLAGLLVLPVLLPRRAAAQANPVLVGRQYATYFGVVPNGIAVSGNYAYLANDTDGLRIIDVSDPRNPTNAAHINDGGRAFAVVLSGNYAYLACDTNGLQIYDISSPTHPVKVGAYKPRGTINVRCVALSGNYAIMQDNSVHMIDISDPANPVLVTTNTVWAGDIGIGITGHYAYMVGVADELYTIDISNPTNLLSGYSVYTRSYARGIAVSGKYAYVLDSAMTIFDLSTPKQPVQVGYTTNSGSSIYPHGITIINDYAYVANSIDGFRIYNVSDHAHPRTVGWWNWANVTAVAISGNYAYLAAPDGLRVLSLDLQLKSGRTGTNSITFTWPTNSIGMGLQQTSDFTSSDNWVNLTNRPAVVAQQNQIILPVSSSNQFYRLKSQ